MDDSDGIGEMAQFERISGVIVLIQPATCRETAEMELGGFEPPTSWVRSTKDRRAESHPEHADLQDFSNGLGEAAEK